MVEVIKSHFCPHNSQSQNELDTLYFCNLQFHLLSEEGSVGVSVKCRTFTTYLYIMTQKSVDWCRTVGVRHCRAENSVECPGSMIYSVVISRCRKLWTSPTSWWMDEYPGAVHSLVYQQNYIVLRALLQKWPMGKMKHSAVHAMNNSLCCSLL